MQRARWAGWVFVFGLSGAATTARAQSQPDFAAISMNAPRGAVSGSEFIIHDRICNLGVQHAGWSDVAYFLSTDSAITVDDTLIGYRDVPFLAASACEDGMGTAIAGVPDGEYWIGMIVDGWDFVPETNPNNNALNAGRFNVGNFPDFVMTEISGPASAQGGEEITVYGRICNIGSASGPAEFDVFIADTFLGTFGFWSSIAPNQCFRLGVQVHAFPGFPYSDGAYDLVAVARASGGQAEADVSNNRLVGAKIGIGYGPDLRISQLTTLPAAFPGQSIPVTAQVCNDGTASSSPAPLALYTSTDAVIDGGAGDVFLGVLNVGSIPAGSCRFDTATVPALLPPPGGHGAYRLGGIADHLNHLLELNEGNNRFAGPTLNIGPGRDLVITSVTGPYSAQPGQEINVRARVCNYGTESTSGADLRFYLSHDQVIDGTIEHPGPSSDAFLGSTVLSSNLAPGACHEVSAQVTADYPGPYVDGAYHLGAIVDEGNTIVELNDANNELIGARMGVGNLPDLVVTEIIAPANVPANEALEIRAVICNRGTAPAALVEASIYASLDEEIDGGFEFPVGSADSFLGTVSSPETLFPGQCRSMSGPMFSTPPPGYADLRFHLGAIVDEYQQIPEFDDTNNLLVQGRMGIGLGPDLVVTSISAPPSAQSGQTIAVEAKICNQGTQTSLPARINLYTSADTSIRRIVDGQVSDTLLATLETGTLSPGRCRKVSANVVAQPGAPFTAGPYYLGTIINEDPLVWELDNSNDVFVGAQLGVGSRPDLVVTAISAPTSRRAGHGFFMRVTVCNRGTTATPLGSEVAVYASSDDQPGADIEIARAAFLALEPSLCADMSTNFLATLANEGVYYLIAAADAPQDVVELNETNNYFVGPQLGIGDAPDLVVASLSAPPSVQASDTFTVQAEICNRGTQPLASGSINLYLSADRVIDGVFLSPYPSDDSFLDTIFISQPLAAGLCRVESAALSAFTPAPFVDGPYYLAAIADEEGAVPEVNELNNVYVGEPIGVGFFPDLVVTAIEAPSSALSGTSIRLAATVCNRGTAPAGGVDITFYMSADETIDGVFEGLFPGDDAYLGSAVTSNTLYPGQCAVASSSLSAAPPAPGLDGAYSLGAIADEFSAETELIESNNKFTGPQLGIGVGPDLVVTAIEAPHSNGTGPFIATVCNRGTLQASNVGVTLYTSTDTTIRSIFGSPAIMEDTFVSILTLNQTLFAGQCRAVSGEFWAPPPPPHVNGSYYIGAIVDDFGSIPELIESNNTFVGRRISIGVVADLVVTAVSAPASALPGASIEVSATLCNHGSARAHNSNVWIYTSADAVVSGSFNAPLPLLDAFLGSISFPQIEGGDCKVRSATLPALLPPPYVEGVYYLRAFADETNQILENSEHDNRRAVEKIAIGNGPDLVVTSITGPSGAVPGNSFTAQATICNRGTASVSSTEVHVYLSADQLLEGIFQSNYPTNDEFVGSISVTRPLEPGQCRTESGSMSASIPAPHVEGSYYLGAIVDELEGVEELDETNNEFAGARLGIGTGPDLVVTAIDAPPHVLGGFPAEFSATICNRGTGPAFSAEVSIYASADTVLDSVFLPFPGDDAYLGAINFSTTLNPGQCRSATESFELFLGSPHTDGSYYLGAIVDDGNVQAELDETNNRLIDGRIAIGAGADLVITQIIAPPSATSGQSIPVSARVCNQGTASVWGISVALYTSADETLVTRFGPEQDDAALGYIHSFDPLGAKQCRMVSGSVNVYPAEPYAAGPYYLAGVAGTGSIEMDYENNSFVGPLIGIGSRADLVVRSISAPASSTPGAPVNVQATVCNDGTSSAPSNALNIYLSADAVVLGMFAQPGHDDSFLGTLSFDALNAGACAQISGSLAAVAPFPGFEGSYYLAGLVDESNSVVELNEANNFALGGMIGVGHGPDLVVESVSAPSGVVPGQTVEVEVRICNRGTTTAASADATIYTSVDAIIEGTYQAQYPGARYSVGGGRQRFARAEHVPDALSLDAHPKSVAVP